MLIYCSYQHRFYRRIKKLTKTGSVMKHLFFTSKHCLLVLTLLLLVACGGGSGSEPNPPPVTNTQPNAFSFTAQSDVEPGATVTSNSITVSGINAAATISIQNGEYSVNNGDFAAGSATVNNAAQIRVRHQASSQFATSQTTTLTIGGVSANFVSTTRDQPPATGTGTPPQASVVFPWSQSKTSAGTLTVRGTATSRNGISALSVNGVPANIHSQSVAAQRVSAQSFHAQGSNGEDEEEEFEWTADVEIESDSDTELTVAVSDADGNENIDAASVRVNTLRAPAYLVYDDLQQRLIGVLDNQDIVAIDHTDLTYQLLTSVDYISELNFDAANNRLIYSYHHEDTVSLYEVDLEQGQQKLLTNFAPEIAPDVQLIGVQSVFDPINQHAFVLLKLLEANSIYATDHLYQFNLADETSRLLSYTNLTDSPWLTIKQMTMLGDRLFATAGHFLLVEVNTQTGERSIVMDLPDFSPMALTSGSNSDQLFIAGMEGIVKVELAFPLSYMLSAESSTTLYPTSQIQDILLLDEHTLLVADSGYNTVLKVDSRTGERSAFVSSGIGSGRGLMMPNYLTFGADSNTLYVLDNGSNAAESLFSIDLSSGDRTMLADINQAGVNYHSGLFFYEANNALLIGLDDAILSVALPDGTVSVVSGMGVGEGPSSGGMTGGDFHAETATLYMAQPNLANSVLQIDVSTGQRSLHEFDGSAGTAGIIEGVNDVAVDTQNNQLYLASQLQNLIYRLDLETGETELIVDRCLNFNNQNILDIGVNGIQKISFDEERQQLRILAGQLAIYDLASQSCTVKNLNRTFLNALPLDDGTYLMTSQNALEHFDPKSLATVIISK
ncbi:hypothetical protein QWY20_06835 [Alkalimonas sp. MEB108]|uniref:NHL repeat containing protein n=1 Tax=Alkalimonas cellulosilytica TaxID=3058395 RepID=A0ABU7J3U4_9GAMM|nr:hypothetical protein [Alkalimonas sp. MEB108]MEE2001165.1 hypothetical protein [Alkalimonas sp. MEB108]